MRGLLTLLILLACLISQSQVIGVGQAFFEENTRRNQSLRNTDSLLSFCIRPIISSKSEGIRSSQILTIPAVWLLSPSLDMEYNGHHPYSSNNSSFIPAKGLQTRLSVGLDAEWKFVDFRFRPEILYAANPVFEGFPQIHETRAWMNRYHWWNLSDSPEQFGAPHRFNLNFGQSYFRLKYNTFSLGVSTENLWWGPGKYTSLTMSNNAPGFLHLKLQTDRPSNTPIGSFEGQLISGWLRSSGFSPPDTLKEYRRTRLYQEIEDENRYLSGITLVYGPKWIPGLFIGGAYVSQQYVSDAGKNVDILPAINDLFSRNIGADNQRRPDNYASLFFRWNWINGLGEIYFEYGKKDFAGTLRTQTLAPEESAAFVFGLNRLFPLKEDQFLEFSVELSQLAQQNKYEVLQGDSWYIDQYIRHGYTHQGQWVGASIGPGSNRQTFELNWLKKTNKLGFIFERELHNSDFYYYAFTHIRDFRRYWVDYSFGLQGFTDIDKLKINFRALYTYSMNYQWELERQPGDPYLIPGRDVSNFHLTMNLIYPIDL